MKNLISFGYFASVIVATIFVFTPTAASEVGGACSGTTSEQGVDCEGSEGCQGAEISISSVSLDEGGKTAFCSSDQIDGLVSLTGNCCGGEEYEGSMTLSVTLSNSPGVHNNEPVTVSPCSGDLNSNLSESYTVVEVTQFTPLAGQFPICADESRTKDDFVIVTNPSSAASLLTWEWDGSENNGSTAVTKQARLTLNGATCKSTNYEVYPSGGEVQLGSDVPGNSAGPTVIDGGDYIGLIYTHIVDLFLTSTYRYELIHQVTGGVNSTFSVGVANTVTNTQSGTLNYTATVGGASVGGSYTESWESSSTYNFNISIDPDPFEYRFEGYQKVFDVNYAWQDKRNSGPGGSLELYDSDSGPYKVGIGLSSYHTILYKGCP